ncbi:MULTISPECIES: BlaI/MecI/CopY family transcriptional regulator [unclassified Nocardioides]|uniref:BlaI/MecI/CopY family transcriptional regulator n=1 Tax=unclassified Nocardioides TaxID=2615069 RepID=UPI0009F042B2|nr:MULTISPECIES: BlaI/MecI/CopY family transcriptional regulator [unclassified Nocardioides]GAW49753.1 Transcriptional regulator-like protein [Nocardioides sp. PD653-B2]GAW56507.1 Transcriptional regulator-like protein [Nocardioides sp. PD653]
MRTLGDLEALVMEQLWKSTEPQSVRQVLDSLPHGRSRAYTTVLTVLDNLFHKGFVERRRAGRSYVYAATQTRAQYTAEAMEAALAGAGAGDRDAALMSFVDQLTAHEAAQLRALLAERDPS